MSNGANAENARRDIRFRNMMNHIMVHPEYYEPLDRYQPGDDMVKVAREVLPDEWRLVKDRLWFYAMPPAVNNPTQGWKIHVSASITNYKEILQRAIPVLTRFGVAFKFSCDTWMLMMVNAHFWDRGASGKFITIYPQSEAQFKALIEALYQELKEFEGPYILSDKRYKDCKVLYYRYGQIQGLGKSNYDGSTTPIILSPDGQQVPDIRTPYYVLPSWVQEIFPDEDEQPESVSLKDGRYLITKVLGFSNSGGVYRGTDLETGQDVVIKEARPHTSPNVDGTTAITNREREWRVLNRLKGTGLAPEPIDLFWEWEHLFLVESFVEGTMIRSFPAAKSALLKIDPSDEQITDYQTEILGIAQELVKGLKELHEHQIVFGDLSANNVLLKPEGGVAFIDLEGAFEIGVDKTSYMYTPGFATQERLNRKNPIFEDDYFALGVLLMWLIHPITGIRSLKKDVVGVFLTDIERDLGLPTGMADIIRGLTHEQAEQRPKLDVVSQSLAQAQVQLPQPAKPVEVPVAQLQKTLERIADHILSSASYDRTDRLFPADPGLGNPLSAAHGALGVATFLHKVLGDVPADVMQWIDAAMKYSSGSPVSLYHGHTGAAWLLSELGHVERGAKLLKGMENHSHLYTASDVYYGLAGFGLAQLYFWNKTKHDDHLTWAVRAGNWLLRHKQENERGYYWPTPEGGVMVGYARGATGIALFLLYLFGATGDDRYFAVGRRALDHDLSYGIEVDGGKAISFPEDAAVPIVYPYWFRGSAGVGTTLLRFMGVTGDETLRTTLQRLAPDTWRKYAVFPGLFNGLAGLGNFALDSYQFTGCERYAQEAHRIAQGLLLFQAERPGGIAFPGDHLFRLSTDFATGSAGIGLFLHRMLHEGENFNFVIDELLPAAKHYASQRQLVIAHK